MEAPATKEKPQEHGSQSSGAPKQAHLINKAPKPVHDPTKTIGWLHVENANSLSLTDTVITQNLAYVAQQNKVIMAQQEVILHMARGGKDVKQNVAETMSEHTWSELPKYLANVTETVKLANIHFIGVQNETILEGQKLVVRALERANKDKKRKRGIDDGDDDEENEASIEDDVDDADNALKMLTTEYKGLVRDEFNNFVVKGAKLHKTRTKRAAETSAQFTKEVVSISLIEK